MNIAKVAEQYLKKGMKVYIEEALHTHKWQDQHGGDRYTTEVILQKFQGELQMLTSGGGERPSAPNGQDDYGRQSGARDRSGQGQGQGSGNTGRDLDDEIRSSEATTMARKNLTPPADQRGDLIAKLEGENASLWHQVKELKARVRGETSQARRARAANRDREIALTI